MNFLKETLDALKSIDKTPQDILWIGTPKEKISWQDFEQRADFEYCEGFGTQEINPDLIIQGKDWRMFRDEYDGSESWDIIVVIEEPAITNPELILINTESGRTAIYDCSKCNRKSTATHRYRCRFCCA